jgi:transposase
MGRMEIITGCERRRRWSSEQKRSILEEASRPGVSAAAVARRHDILPQQIYAWRRRFRRADRAGGDGVSFLPVELVCADVPLSKAATGARGDDGWHIIEVACRNGRVLKASSGLEPKLLRGLIRMVEEA